MYEKLNLLDKKRVALNFYAKADKLSTFSVILTYNFGTGGSPSKPVILQKSLHYFNRSWMQYTVNFDTSLLSGKVCGSNGDSYLEIKFEMPDNSLIYYIRNVTLEELETF